MLVAIRGSEIASVHSAPVEVRRKIGNKLRVLMRKWGQNQGWHESSPGGAVQAVEAASMRLSGGYKDGQEKARHHCKDPLPAVPVFELM